MGVGVRAVRGGVIARRGCGVGLSATSSLGVHLFAAAVVTTESEIKGREVAIACGVHEEVGLCCDRPANLSGDVRPLIPKLG